jgi:hypothetical protein
MFHKEYFTEPNHCIFSESTSSVIFIMKNVRIDKCFTQSIVNVYRQLAFNIQRNFLKTKTYFYISYKRIFLFIQMGRMKLFKRNICLSSLYSNEPVLFVFMIRLFNAGVNPTPFFTVLFSYC